MGVGAVTEDSIGGPILKTLVTADEARDIPTVIGIAWGKEKVAALHSAILGGYINSLVTDHDTAQLLLATASHPAS